MGGVNLDQYLASSITESVNPKTKHIDECTTHEILTLINQEDQIVTEAVSKELDSIAQAVDLIYGNLRKGGHMLYVGAGTSGRLGVLDASECPPTYGTEPLLVQGHIAGGDEALRHAIEGCEDDEEAGARLMDEAHVTGNDVVIGITASGAAPYVIGAIKRAKALNAATIAVVNNNDSKLSEICDICIALIVGPEVITGSTRMKSGTAQKLVLNMLTTSVMIKLGKVYNNLMVDLKASNKKLYERAIRIVCQVTGVTVEEAKEALEQADMRVKVAIMMIKTGKNYADACALLESADNQLKRAISMAKEV